jgi:hypothetical protein
MLQRSDEQVCDCLERDDATKDVCRKITSVMRFLSTREVRALVLYTQRKHYEASRERFHRRRRRSEPYMSLAEFSRRYLTPGAVEDAATEVTHEEA